MVSTSNCRREDLTSSVFLRSIWKASNQERRRLSKYLRASHSGSCLELKMIWYHKVSVRRKMWSVVYTVNQRLKKRIPQRSVDTNFQTTTPIRDSELCFYHLSISVCCNIIHVALIILFLISMCIQYVQLGPYMYANCITTKTCFYKIPCIWFWYDPLNIVEYTGFGLGLEFQCTAPHMSKINHVSRLCPI